MKRLLGVFLILCAPAYADSFATSEAFLNWEGLSFTTTGTLRIEGVTFFSAFSTSLARSEGTTVTDHKSSGDFPATWTITQASSSTTWIMGEGSAAATTNNGLLNSSADVTTTDFNFHSSLAGAQSAMNFRFSGTGTGTVRVDIPYTMAVSCSPDSADTRANVLATVSGVTTSSMTVEDTLFCSEGVPAKTGILSAFKDLDNPVNAPILIRGSALAYAQTTVPEPASVWLICTGIGLVAGLSRSRRAQNRV
jgi:hypothetical protein